MGVSAALSLSYLGACAGSPGTLSTPSQSPSSGVSSASAQASSPTLSASSAGVTASVSAVPSGSTPAKVAKLPALPGYEASAVLVWIKPSGAKGTIKTRWIEEKSGEANVVREAPAPIVASFDALWTIRTQTTVSKTCGCKGVPATPEPFETSTITATNLATKKTKVLAKNEPDGWPKCSGDLAGFSGTISIRGVVGSTLVYETSHYGMGCMAAHPYFGQSTEYLDFISQSVEKLEPPKEILPGLIAEAATSIQQEFGDCVMDKDEKPVYFSFSPTFSAEGTIEASYLFTQSAPYVCGTGPGHYSVPAEVSSKVLPSELKAWSTSPAWVASYLKQHASEVIGLSPLPKSLDAAAALTQLSSVK
ncbi:MAG: hypothetical protein U0165_20555 [Polyangiaceae bacterium]